MYPRGAQTQCLFMLHLGDKKKEEKRKGERGGLEIRGLFRNGGRREEFRRKPPGQCSRRHEDDNSGAFTSRRHTHNVFNESEVVLLSLLV